MIKKAGVVIRKEIKGKTYVLLHHTISINYWQFPKGHVEEGESLIQTAIREAKEETGLEVELIKELGIVRYNDSNKNSIELHLFLAEIKNGELTPESNDYKLKWFEINIAPNILTYIEWKQFLLSNIKKISYSFK
jgi:bis(5'-nucleosidyl)-tetraphosphatase